MATAAPKHEVQLRPAPAPAPAATPLAAAPKSQRADTAGVMSNAVSSRLAGSTPPRGQTQTDALGNAAQIRIVTKSPSALVEKSGAKPVPGKPNAPARGAPVKDAKQPGEAKAPETAKHAETPAGKSEKGAKKPSPGKRGGAGAGPDADAGAAGEPATAGAGDAAGIALLMPEPPSALTSAARGRMGAVQHGVAKTTKAHADLPAADVQTSQARGAVTPPQAQANAEASGDLLAELDEAPAPSPEIEKLCAKIYKVINDKRPPDEDKLVEADPQKMAEAAGGELNQTVQTDTDRVAGGYDQLKESPQGKPPAPGQQTDAPPAHVEGPEHSAAAAAPDAVPAANVSLQADVAASDQRMTDAGMNKPMAKEVKSGPIADARAAQDDLQGLADTGPAEALAGQQNALAGAQADMADLQKNALKALHASRLATMGDNRKQHTGMVESEGQTRTRVSKEARDIFEAAQKEVRDQLKPLTKKALEQWSKGVDVLATKFKARLHEVEGWIKERHKGVTGAIVSVWDSATGLPGWVTKAYDVAEKEFGDGVCALVREISKEVNTIVAACVKIVANADKRIADLFKNLPDNLKDWAQGEQTKFHEQLEGLKTEATQTRDNFNRDLIKRAGQAVQDVREQIHKLRQEAKGFLQKVAEAIKRFIDDPIRAIIEGLLELLGIPPADFWAVVDQLKHVISDIADDPGGFTTNLLHAVGQGFSQFFDNIGEHLLKGMLDWLLSGLKDVGVELPKDLSLKSVITFFLQLMGITWPRIRKLLAKHVGEENVALIEKAWSIISTLIEQGPEGIFELIKDKLDPKNILDMVLQMAKDYIISALIKQATITILSLFNPVGAGYQLLKLLYKVLKWIFNNAARIFKLIQTIVQGAADIVAGNIGGMANAIEKALAGMLVTVIDFVADYLGFGDLPEQVAKTIGKFQGWVESILDKVIGWLVTQGKALLKAIGIGKEDEKKGEGKYDGEIGKVVKFSAGGELHRLRIVVQGDHAVLLIASDEMPVDAFLAEYTTLANGLKDEQKAKVLDLIGKARQLCAQTTMSADQEIAIVKTPSSKPEQKQTADDATEAKEDSLVVQLKELIALIKHETLGAGADVKPNDILKTPSENSVNEYIVLRVKEKVRGRYAVVVKQRGRQKGELVFYYEDYGKTWEKRGEIDEQEYVRKRSPDSAAQAYAANWKECPVYGPLGGPVSADHIFALARIMTLPGFDGLALPDKVAVANVLVNIIGLGRRTNSSKQDTSWKVWPGIKNDATLPKIPPQVRQDMITREEAGQAAVKQEIKNRA